MVDKPSDREKMNAGWRMGREHAEDILSIIHQIKKGADVPIWVVGTSMGTFSAANAAIRLKSEVSGLGLTSTITKSHKKWAIRHSHPKAVIDMALENISVPSLIVSHKGDECSITPASDSESLKKKLKNAKNVQVILFEGDHAPVSDPCEALSQHGFYGIEQEVVDAIAHFIKSN